MMIKNTIISEASDLFLFIRFNIFPKNIVSVLFMLLLSRQTL